jgi:flagellar FlgN protein
MTATVAYAPRLGPAVIAHLEEQIASARRMLELTLRQAQAIRARDVDAVVRKVSDLNVEIGRRERLEHDRSALLDQAGAMLGKPGTQVVLDDIARIVEPGAAARAQELSLELRGLLSELGRETQMNRSLMRQELTFLDHLLRLAGHPAEPGYSATGEQALSSRPVAPRTPAARRVLDMEA